MNDNYFVFREIRSVNELQTLLSLRYQVYRETNLKYFIEENEYGIDLDGYDLISRHFGLFENDNKPIGYIRVIEDARSPQFEVISELISKYPSLAPKAKINPDLPFPSMTYWDHEICQLYKKMKKNQAKLVEASRFVLKPNCRSISLAKHIAESAIAIYFFCFYDNAIISCSQAHKRFYNRYGFSLLKEGKAFQSEIELESSFLLGSTCNIPDTLCPHFKQMADVYKKTGQICYNPSKPDYFYHPISIAAQR